MYQKTKCHSCLMDEHKTELVSTDPETGKTLLLGHDKNPHADCECGHCLKSREGVKNDEGKARTDLLPPLALLEVAHVLTFGAKEYAPDNWRKVRGWRWRYMGACLRHVFARLAGKRLDDKSGLPHLAHAACCLLFMIELEELESRGAKVPDGDAQT